MIITAAFVPFNGVAVKPLVHLLCITNKNWPAESKKRERMNSIPL